MATADKAFREPIRSANMADYEVILEDRPNKFDQHAAGYRKTTGSEPQCISCIHFFSRQVDNWHVCEIVRPIPETEINPAWTCRFQTADGRSFPLYKD